MIRRLRSRLRPPCEAPADAPEPLSAAAAPDPPAPPLSAETTQLLVERETTGETHRLAAVFGPAGVEIAFYEAPDAEPVELDATALRFLLPALRAASAHLPHLHRAAASGSLARHPELHEWRHLRSASGLTQELATDLSEADDPGLVFIGPDRRCLRLTLEGAVFLRSALEAVIAQDLLGRSTAARPKPPRSPAKARAFGLRTGERWDEAEEKRLP